MLIDTHCHLNFAAFEADWQQVTDEAVKNGVEKMIVVGTDLTSSAKAVAMAQKHEASNHLNPVVYSLPVVD